MIGINTTWLWSHQLCHWLHLSQKLLKEYCRGNENTCDWRRADRENGNELRNKCICHLILHYLNFLFQIFFLTSQMWFKQIQDMFSYIFLCFKFQRIRQTGGFLPPFCRCCSNCFTRMKSVFSILNQKSNTGQDVQTSWCIMQPSRYNLLFI